MVSTALDGGWHDDETPVFVFEGGDLVECNDAGRSWRHLISDIDEPYLLRTLTSQFSGLNTGLSEGTVTIDTSLTHPDGTVRRLRLEARGVDERRIQVAVRDVGQPIDSRLSARAFQRVFAHSPTGMAVLDASARIIQANDALSQLLGVPVADLIGIWAPRVFLEVDRDKAQGALTQLDAGGVSTHITEVRCSRDDGTNVFAEMVISRIDVDAPDAKERFILQVMDVTERRAHQHRLSFQAHHDAVTGLPNRRYLTDALGRALAGVGQDGLVAVLLLDIDNFKVVNDSLGPTAGDELLVTITERLRSVLTASDVIGRFGDDAFVVMRCNASGAADARDLAEILRAAVARPLGVRESEFHLSASVGIALGSSRDEPDPLLRDADMAMSLAKERGKNRSEVFDDGLRAALLGRVDTEGALRKGLKNKEMDVHFQPIVDVDTGDIEGFEALARWNRGGTEIVLPSDFVQIAEETGMIIRLGRQVLNLTCQALADFGGGAEPLSGRYCSVNVSPHQLSDPNFVLDVKRNLHHYGLRPQQICLEITESLAMKNISRVRERLLALREIGVQLALDDFGTGYASLAQLRKLPFTMLKVDRAFTADIESEHGTELFRAMVDMAHALGMNVVAEGVERERQLERLRTVGCDRAQGFFIGRPATAQRTADLL